MADIARLAALRSLDAVIRKGAWPNEACDQFMYGLNDVDRAFAHKLLMGTLEEYYAIDHTIKTYTLGRGINGLVRNVLRLGCYQILYLDKVPDRAACWSSVEQIKDVGKGGLSGFVNGVLRRVTRDGAAPAPLFKDDPIGNISVLTSQPRWLVKMWTKELGDSAKELLSFRAEPSITIRANSFRGLTPSGLTKILDEQNIDYTYGKWVSSSLNIKQSARILKSDLFALGQITVQGEMSQWLAKLAAEFKPKSIWDMCAAPGGKTASLAGECPDAKIYATDLYKHRVDLILKTLDRLGINNVTCEVHDSTLSYHKRSFDLVILDTPCSGLGTLSANPDIRMNRSLKNIKSLVSIQEELIVNASRHVNEDGILIYSTCTISRRENEGVVKYFLDNNPNFKLLPPTNVPEYYLVKDDVIMTLPNIDFVDGFFIARFRRIL